MVSKPVRLSSQVGVIDLDGTHNLVWSGLTGYVGLLNKKVARSLQTGSINTLADSTRADLVRHGVIVNQDICERDLLDKIVLSHAKRQIGESPPSITLYLSRTCNCACTYCYQRCTDLPPLMDKAIIPLVTEYAKFLIPPKGSLRVHFFGGEPMLNMGFVQSAVTAFSKAQSQGGWSDLLFEITTNGVHWPPNMNDVFAPSQLHRVQLTFDGLRRNHNLLRPLRGSDQSSFDALWRNIPTIKRQSKSLVFRLNVCDENKADILPLAQLLYQNFGGPATHIYLSHMRMPCESNLKPITPNDYTLLLKRFFSWYFSVTHAIHPLLLPRRRYTPCPVAFRMPKWIDTDGCVLQCQHQREIGLPPGPTISNLLLAPDTISGVSSFGFLLAEGQLLLDKCRECRYFAFCGGICPGGLVSGGASNPTCSTWEMRLRLYAEEQLKTEAHNGIKNNT